jgi:hypothetical protein
MKWYLLASVFAIITTAFFSCSNAQEKSDMNHEKAWYRIVGIGVDTSVSESMFTRKTIDSFQLLKQQAIALSGDSDSYLSARLIGYSNKTATVEVTNKTGCQIHTRWSWEGGLLVTNDIGNDVIYAYQTKTFTLVTNGKTGNIRVKSQAVGNCSDSKNLKIPITAAILPIKWVNRAAEYDVSKGGVTINWEIANPEDYNLWVIQKTVNNQWVDIMSIPCDGKQSKWSILVLDNYK